MNEPKRVRLLVIDEHDGYFGLLSQYAEIHAADCEFDLRFAGCRDDALKEIYGWNPSVILLDAHLPDMNGFDFLSECKDGHAPVIVTSDHRSKGIEDAARTKGAMGYLAKSDNPDEMEQLILKLASVSSSSETKH